MWHAQRVAEARLPAFFAPTPSALMLLAAMRDDDAQSLTGNSDHAFNVPPALTRWRVSTPFSLKMRFGRAAAPPPTLGTSRLECPALASAFRVLHFTGKTR
jgi:hypothetical protein